MILHKMVVSKKKKEKKKTQCVSTCLFVCYNDFDPTRCNNNYGENLSPMNIVKN